MPSFFLCYAAAYYVPPPSNISRHRHRHVNVQNSEICKTATTFMPDYLTSSLNGASINQDGRREKGEKKREYIRRRMRQATGLSFTEMKAAIGNGRGFKSRRQKIIHDPANLQTTTDGLLESIKEESPSSLNVTFASDEVEVEVEDDVPMEKPSISEIREQPKAKMEDNESSQITRWAIAREDFDLSGEWHLVVDDDFLKKYDSYLSALGQPALVRSVACSIVRFTKEEYSQSDHGRVIRIKGTNPRGIWTRDLVSSGACSSETSFEKIITTIKTADGEDVSCEAWWGHDRKTHKSWMRGGKKWGGGDFESTRYLDDDGYLLCESVFHPSDPTREKSHITWKFKKS